MKVGLQQSVRLGQELRINPRLYQAMDLLYMPLLDLQQHLKQELVSNPFLEMVEPTEDGVDDGTETPETKEDENEIDWEDILLDGFESGGRREEYEEREYYEPTAVATRDLYDHLRDQISLFRLELRQIVIAEEIIGNIDETGFLTCELEAIVESLNNFLQSEEAIIAGFEGEEPFTVEEAAGVLVIIQGLDPAGIAARNLRECLLLQLGDGDWGNTLVYDIVEKHFDQLVNHRWAEISKELGVSPQEVQAAADEIAKLDPKPGLQYSVGEGNYIIADLVVEKVDGDYIVFHNDTALPRLRLSRSYREVARDKAKFKGESKEFISNKLNNANWMLQAIEQRRQTMLKVMNFIVNRQRDFFEEGIEHLKPLTLREVAEVISMHESTVSRVTNQKYVQTPRGVLPLKFFFSSGLSTDSGEDVSARGIKARIQKLVAEEDPKKPLTDQAIVDILKREGINIARRTVAKYRDQLGVLSARMRKRV
ncbi:MAG: RNA polymerase factor sigma-54 [Gemmatimonadota bacterium]|nr:MAG: RNA polymerase factor sigma-54 [Gemmatimonadota bacterium]